MNKYFTTFLLFFSLAGGGAFAQDLIVSNEGDSLNCTIITQNLKSIHFFYKENDELVTRELPKSLFKSIIVGYYNRKPQPASDTIKIQSANAVSTPANPPQEKIIEEKSEVVITQPESSAGQETNAPADTIVIDTSVRREIVAVSPAALALSSDPFASSNWYAGFRGGYANRLFSMGNKFTPIVRQYQKELKSGYAVGIDGGYFLRKNIGIGLDAELYKSVARMRDDSRNDAISLKYIGPSVLYKKMLQNQKSSVLTGFTIGYQSYVNRGEELGKDFTLKGKAIGWGVNVGLDYKISPQAAISFSAGCLFGTIYKFNKESGDKKEVIKLTKDNSEDLSRISLTIGLRFF